MIVLMMVLMMVVLLLPPSWPLPPPRVQRARPFHNGQLSIIYGMPMMLLIPLSAGLGGHSPQRRRAFGRSSLLAMALAVDVGEYQWPLYVFS
jgi:hypothetical protein